MADEDRHLRRGAAGRVQVGRPAPAWPTDGTAIPAVAAARPSTGRRRRSRSRRCSRPAVVRTAHLPAVVAQAGDAVTPGRISGTPAASARSAASAAITRTRSPAARAAGRRPAGTWPRPRPRPAAHRARPRGRIAWCTVPSSRPNVSCGVGSSSRCAALVFELGATLPGAPGQRDVDGIGVAEPEDAAAALGPAADGGRSAPAPAARLRGRAGPAPARPPGRAGRRPPRRRQHSGLHSSGQAIRSPAAGAPLGHVRALGAERGVARRGPGTPRCRRAARRRPGPPGRRSAGRTARGRARCCRARRGTASRR